MFYHKGRLCTFCLYILYLGVDGILPFGEYRQSILQLAITVNLVFGQEKHDSSDLFQIVQNRPMRESGSLNAFDIVQNDKKRGNSFVMRSQLYSHRRKRLPVLSIFFSSVDLIACVFVSTISAPAFPVSLGYPRDKRSLLRWNSLPLFRGRWRKGFCSSS